MSQRPESFDLPTQVDAPSPMARAAQDAYQPEAQKFFGGCALQPNSLRMGDDALDRFFKTSLEYNVYQRDGKVDTYKAIRDADSDITLTGARLQNAITKIERGDLTGAMKDIYVSLRLSGRGLSNWNKAKGVDSGGDDLTGAYSKDAIGDGVNEIREGRKEMRAAHALLRQGNGTEAKEALQEALRDLSSGQSQARDGADCKTGISSVDNPYQRRLNASGEFRRGTEHLERSQGSLSKALESLDGADGQAAIRNLQRSKGQLNFGVNDFKDGMQLGDIQGNDPDEKYKGLTTALRNNWSIDFAVDLIKRGCTEDAKKVIRDSISNLENCRTQIVGEPGLLKGDSNHKKVIQPPEVPGTSGSVRCDDTSNQSLPGDRREKIYPVDGRFRSPLGPGELVLTAIDAPHNHNQDILSKLLKPADLAKVINSGPGNPAEVIDTLPKPGNVLEALRPPMPHEVLGLPHPLDVIDTLPKPGDVFEALRPPMPHELLGLPGPHELLGLPAPEKVIKKVLNAPLDAIKKLLRFF